MLKKLAYLDLWSYLTMTVKIFDRRIGLDIIKLNICLYQNRAFKLEKISDFNNISQSDR